MSDPVELAPLLGAHLANGESILESVECVAATSELAAGRSRASCHAGSFSGNVVLVVTDRALHCIQRDPLTGRPQDWAGTIPLAMLASIEVTTNRPLGVRRARAEVELSDGNRIEFSAAGSAAWCPAGIPNSVRL